MPGGPDVCIEAVGFHYCKSLVHAVMVKVRVCTCDGQVVAARVAGWPVCRFRREGVMSGDGGRGT